ncbi:MAG: DNA/RNA nuclease SfsA [Synergistaceae bacterium]|nr:DNA/RNA nuclease SfsA [Synergistaceae bacterium]
MRASTMQYSNIKQARFLWRPNRFIANIELGGQEEIAHVKNTGRCKELLVPGATIFVQKADSSSRRTQYDLIAVYKGSRLINMDSQAPNKVFAEFVRAGNLFENVTLIKPETRYKDSRADFYIEADGREIIVEVKGVTLEKDGVVLFPDAPTERGVRHLEGLCEAKAEGYDAYAVFIVQMKDVLYFTPNDETHKAFGDALRKAASEGVSVLAIDCDITESSILARDFVEVRL